jgi:hypothetical protein
MGFELRGWLDCLWFWLTLLTLAASALGHPTLAGVGSALVCFGFDLRLTAAHSDCVAWELVCSGRTGLGWVRETRNAWGCRLLVALGGLDWIRAGLD